jgi:calcineurin-like phosphoesterase family protein
MTLPNLKKDTVWITSDTHFSHTNICRGVSTWDSTDKASFDASTRDFADLSEMDTALITSINEVVQPQDWLLHLGDWSFGGADNIMKFREQISCNNILIILGNHDHHIPKFASAFSDIGSYAEIDLDKRKKIVLCHYPISDWNNMNKGSFMLHGHCHLPADRKISQGRRMDVGMDGNNYKPYLLEDVLSTLSQFSNTTHH